MISILIFSLFIYSDDLAQRKETANYCQDRANNLMTSLVSDGKRFKKEQSTLNYGRRLIISTLGDSYEFRVENFPVTNGNNRGLVCTIIHTDKIQRVIVSTEKRSSLDVNTPAVVALPAGCNTSSGGVCLDINVTPSENTLSPSIRNQVLDLVNGNGAPVGQ